MEQILSGCDGVLTYRDDIVVHAPTKELHDVRLKKVLQRLREFNVTLNEDKCKFGVSEIKFNGHRLSATGLNHFMITFRLCKISGHQKQWKKFGVSWV